MSHTYRTLVNNYAQGYQLDAAMKTASGTTTRKAEQSRETQGRLLKAAKELFTTRGYGGTALEDVVAKAGMTRGALYHQYSDKRDLFRAVFQATEEELGQKIAMAAAAETDPWEQLRAGARAVLETATDPAIRRIVLTDGPSVLGWEEWRRIDEQYSLAMVRMVFEMNIAAGNVAPQPIEPLAHVIVGALNEASLAVAASDDPERVRDEFLATFDRILEALRMVARADGRRQQ
jgi:AcrR family transcriptional regulator